MNKFQNVIYVLFTTIAFAVVIGCSPSFTDERDGQSYDVVEIAGQLWMAENLNFAGGSAGADGLDGVVAAGSFCPEGDVRKCNEYGRLYTWDAARKACPAGWRLPSVADFEKLIAATGPDGGVVAGPSGDKAMALSGEGAPANRAGAALKSSGGWFKKGNGSDELGFAALPAGYMTEGKFDGIGGYAHIWSSTADPQESSFAHYLYLDFSSDRASISSFSITDARSVRCVKAD